MTMRSVLLAVALLGCHRPPQPRATVRLLALGDSFTIGTGSSPSQAFPARLAERYRAMGCDVELRNVAVNGYSTRDVIELELNEIDSFHPTMITFAAGANDLVRGVPRETYRSNVAAILAKTTAAAATIVLPQPRWPRTPTGSMFGVDEQKVIAFDRVLHEEADRAKARFIDLSPLMIAQADKNMTASDGLHPSASAHDEWAEALAREVKCP
jgi:acyl-CoA thioesterase I